MNSSEIIELRKTKRRENRSKVRQALFISEYVYYKYYAVYEEAANFYNQLNTSYPVKHDLRRTDEFKAMKLGIPFQIKPKKKTRKLFKQHHDPIPVTLGNNFTLICEQLASPDQRLNGDEQPASTEKSTSSEQGTQKIMQLRIPLMEPTLITPTLQTTTKKVPHKQIVDEEVPLESSLNEETPNEIVEPAVFTQTLQTLTEEVIQENPTHVATEEVRPESSTLYPSFNDEIPDDIIERIINELREDPNIKTMMTDIEQELEFEELGAELDIFEADRLENELENLMW